MRLGILCLRCTKRGAYLSTQGVKRSNLESHYQTEQRGPKDEDESELPIHAPTCCISRHSRLEMRWYRSWGKSDILRRERDKCCRRREPRNVSHVRNRVSGLEFARESRLRIARNNSRSAVLIHRYVQRRCPVSRVWSWCLWILNRKIRGIDCKGRFFARELQIAVSRFVRDPNVAENETLYYLSLWAISDGTSTFSAWLTGSTPAANVRTNS